MIADAGDTRAITSFIAWTAWTGVARRPDKSYSYTNNWPPEELVGNALTGDAIMWSTLSLVALLGGSGLVLGVYGRYSRYWHARTEWFRNYPWLSWARMPGDVVFMAGSAPLVWLTLKVALRTRKTASPADQTGTALEATLYTEITPGGAAPAG